MTYVSRKTRIIVSRWSDECDAEYVLRACRKRSDGRLKRHLSCDDCRAWVNDNCIKHEYLVDFMSDGEFLGKPPFRLYGRFIPVPILFKLLQKTKLTDNEESEKENHVRYSKSETNGARSKGSDKISGEVKKSRSDSINKVNGVDNISRLKCEKIIAERRLCQCTLILCRALEKLERIDDIIDFSCTHTENTETTRNEEIQNAFYEAKLRCTCEPRNNAFENVLPSLSYFRKLKECTEYTKLMRKISDYREQLKKNEKCRQKIGQLLRASEQRAEICASSHQVTELYSRREQAHNNKLRKKYEKLTSEKGRLHFELLQTLKCLNSIKRSSRSSISFTKNKSRTSRNSVDFNFEQQNQNTERCRCPCSEYALSTDSENVRRYSSSGDCDVNQGFEENLECDFNNYSEPQNVQMSGGDKFPDDGVDDESMYSEFCSLDDDSKRDVYSHRENEGFDSNKSSTAASRNFIKDRTSRETFGEKTTTEIRMDSSEEKTIKDEEETEKFEEKDTSKKSSTSFFCPRPACRRVIDADSLSAYEDSLTPEQREMIQQAVKSLEPRKLSASQSTKEEKNTVKNSVQNTVQNAVRNTVTFAQNVNDVESSEDDAPEYTVGAGIEDVEKNLRTYEQRLNQLDLLECKVEDLKQKSSEASRLKHKMKKLKAKMCKEKEIEREKCNREITELCSENWELKKHLRQLSAKFEVQCRKIQSLRSANLLKERELQCETEELKKELSKYRDRFERQRKYISNLENEVVVRKTEIENLMNHIRKLTTMEEESQFSASQPKNNIQRSRSYSPEIKTRGSLSRCKPSVRSYRASEEEEGPSCRCQKCTLMEEQSRRRNQQRNSDRVFFSLPPTRETQWCN